MPTVLSTLSSARSFNLFGLLDSLKTHHVIIGVVGALQLLLSFEMYLRILC